MDSHIIKFGDLVIIQGAIQPNQNGSQTSRSSSKKSQVNQNGGVDILAGNSGFLSAMGFTDKRVFLQSVPPSSTDPLKTASTWNNYTDMIFQIWPKLSYEAHKQFKKLKNEKRLVEESPDDSVREAFEEKLKKMGNRVEEEIESNKRQLSSVLGAPVLYGADIQIMHINSQSFLTAKVACSDSDKSAYKFELFNEVNSGMTFKLLPKFKIRQEGEAIQLEDQVLIYSNKLDCYVNFTNDKVIEMDKKIDMYAKARITAPYELRELSSNTQRYEAHVSQFKDCTWKFFYYGKNIEPVQTIVRGGDLLKLRHTEIQALLAADSHSYKKSFKVYGRTYTGEFEEEENSINTIWEVESEEPVLRGDQCCFKDQQGKQNVFRLRHFLTGKLLCVQNGETKDGLRPLLMLSENEYNKQKAPSVTFRNFANNAPPELIYGTAYSIGITDERGAFRYLTVNDREDFSSQKKRKESGGTPAATMNNANNTIFKPLSESEFSTKKKAILCESPEPDAEHAFLLSKIDAEEEHNIRYVASAIATLKYFSNLVKTHKNAHEFNPSILSKTIHVLKDLIYFVHKVDAKTIESSDPITFEGITVASKQRLLKDFRVIEILTEILYYPFEMYFFTLKNIDNLSFKTIFQCCYRLIKHVIKEYRPNEIYASQWLEFYMDQAMRSDAQNDIKAEATLIELIDNNKKILNTKIDRDIILKFVHMLKENKNQKYVNLLRALCVCDGEAVVKNQTDMSRFIIEDVETRNHLIFQDFRKNGLNQLEIRLIDYEGQSGEFWTTIAGFQGFSSELDGSEKYEYFLSMIYLLSDLCLQRNYVAINFLKKIYTYDLCFSTVSDENLSWELRTAFAKLLNTLWLDKNPYQPLNVPQYLVSWDDITPEKCSEITSSDLDEIHATRFDSLKEYLRNYYTKLAKEGCNKIYEEDRNKFTSVMLELSINMVRFGLYQSVDRLKELTRPLLVVLNGMKDVMTPGEYEQFKRKLKNPIKKYKKRMTVTGATIIGDNEERNTERYIENENTLIVMNCKNQICELIKIIMDIDDDLCLRKFLLAFKKEHEMQKDREFDLSENYKGSSDKKSLFGNYKLFKAADDEHDNTDYIKSALDWMRDILENDPLDLNKLAPTNFVKILFDLSLYEHENLVNHSFELLYKAHSRRSRLREMLKDVQIMEDQDRKLAIKTIESEVKSLKELAETTENWYGNKDEESREKTRECIQLLRKLANYLASDNLLGKVQNPEPDAEIITSPPKILPAGFQFEEEDVDNEEMNVDPEFQLILRHLKAFEPMMEILEFEVANTEDEKNEEKRSILKEIVRFLAKFVHHQKFNQNLLMEHLPLFMKIMKNYSNCGVETLLEELFKGNKALVKQTHQVEKFTKNIISMIKAHKTSDNKSAKLLSSLQVLMKHKKQAIKPNQTVILTLLTSRDNSDIFMSLEDKDDRKHIEQLLQDYNHNVSNLEPDTLIEFPGDIDYLSTILEVVGTTCEGKNAVTESRSQNSWPLHDLAFLYEKAGQCWLLKRNILLFFYHVYLDTEREMKEEIDSLNKIFLGIIEDMKSITENYKSQYEIKYHRGTIDNKQAMDILYFDAILPSITDIIVKRFYGELPNYAQGLTSMLQLLRQMESLVVSRTHIKLIRGTIQKFKIYTRDIYHAVYTSPMTPSDFPESLVGISGGISPKKSPGLGSLVRDENTKTLKLKMRLSMMDQTDAFVDYAEEEFESMVTTLIGIEKLQEDHYSSFLPFNDVIKSLISLVDITEGTLEKDMIIIGLKMFRKIIERENKLSHECAAEWESEEWMKFEKKVIERQNQLCKLGLVDMVCHTISHAKDIEVQHESILVGIALLIGGNAKVQEALLEYMQGDMQNSFLMSIKKLVDKNFESMKKEMSIKNKEYSDILLQHEEQALKKLQTLPMSQTTTPKAGAHSQYMSDFGQSSSKELEFDDDSSNTRKVDDVEEAKQALVVLQRTYRFLQLFCEGHNLDMQNQLRVQANADGVTNGKSHDFITQTAYYFNTLIKQVNVDCLDVGVQMLDFLTLSQQHTTSLGHTPIQDHFACQLDHQIHTTVKGLIEALQGPCEGNQLALSKAKIINSCMDFLTMFVKDIDYKKLGFLEPEQVAKANDGTTTAMKLLNALIEGVSYPEIIEEMSSLDLRFLIKKITQEYESFVKGKLKLNVETAKPEQVTGKLGADSFDQPMLESFDVYILLANLADHNIKVASFLKNTDEFTYREKNALKFFKMNVNNIEILFKEKLLKVYYPFYPVCRNLSQNSRKALMVNVNRESATEKINGLVHAAPDLFDEMNHTATLKDQVFFFSQKKYNAIRDFSTLISLTLSHGKVPLFCYTTVVEDSETTRRISGQVTTTINVLGYIQIVTSSTMIVFWIILNGPVILQRRWRNYVQEHKAKIKEDDFDILANLEDEDYDIRELPLPIVLEILARKGPYDPVFNPDGKRHYGHFFIKAACYWRNVTFLMSEGKFIFMAFYLVVSALGVYTEITYCLHLLDVINRSDVLRNVVKAVTYNLKQLLATALLGVIMIYIYSILGFFFVDDAYYNGDINGTGERQCGSMLQCYLTTLNWGLRNGGGIGDTLNVESYASDNKGRYYFRLIFDLSFFLIINIVFLNIIFGIIIDTFAELRDQKSMMDEDMKTKCYICNLDRYTFDKNGTGFENHIEKQHHLWNYVFFIYSVNAKDPTEYNGIESYVQEKLQAEDISWFPLHKAIELGPDHEAPEN